MRHSWVIGAGGLLGSALVRRIRAEGESVVFSPPAMTWSDAELSVQQLGSALREWLSTDGERYDLYWAAGAGVTSTRGDELATELRVFERFLALLGGEVERRGLASAVRFFVTSSVGGVYSGAPGAPYDEDSAVAPVSDYGRTKVATEQAATAAASATGIRMVVGRLSTLYGPGQRVDKPQGFIGHLCRSFLLRRPVSVYVPIDTTRDYLHADDAAELVCAAVDLVGDSPSGSAIVKNIASLSATTIGQVLRASSFVFKRRPNVVLAASPYSSGQVIDLRVVSRVWPELDRLPRRSLVVGLMQTRRSMELAYHSPRSEARPRHLEV